MLGGVPAAYNRAPLSPVGSDTISALFTAGLLPAGVHPAPGDNLETFLARLGAVRLPWEQHFALHLAPYAPEPSYDVTPRTSPRSGGEMLITLAQDQPSLACTCRRSRTRLNRLHPRFFGSLMVHLSQVTACAWPVFTVRDALVQARFSRFSGDGEGFAGHWHELREALLAEHGRAPTRAELRAACEFGPRDFFRLIGIDEVLPALKARLCLNLDELERRAQACARAWALLSQLQTLAQVNARIRRGLSERDWQIKQLLGSDMISPCFLLSGERRTLGDDGHGYVHEVQEALEELWQGVVSDTPGGFMPPISLTVHDLHDAEHARAMLELYHQSWVLTRDIVEALTDPET